MINKNIDESTLAQTLHGSVHHVVQLSKHKFRFQFVLPNKHILLEIDDNTSSKKYAYITRKKFLMESRYLNSSYDGILEKNKNQYPISINSIYKKTSKNELTVTISLIKVATISTNGNSQHKKMYPKFEITDGDDTTIRIFDYCSLIIDDFPSGTCGNKLCWSSDQITRCQVYFNSIVQGKARIYTAKVRGDNPTLFDRMSEDSISGRYALICNENCPST